MGEKLMTQTEKFTMEVIYNRLHHCLEEKIPISKEEKIMITKIIAIIINSKFLV